MFLISKSKTDKGKRYFFEARIDITPKHLDKGLYVGLPHNLEDTLNIDAPFTEINGETKFILTKIVQDCEHLDLRTAFREGGFEEMYAFLNACGITTSEYRIHTIRKK